MVCQMHFGEGGKGRVRVLLGHSKRALTSPPRGKKKVPRLTAAQVEALDAVDLLAASDDLRLDYELRPGDIQLLHNHSILHARSTFTDFAEPWRKRHLLRLWICPENGIPLPEGFAERYGSVSVGDRGGIRVSGATLNMPLYPS